MSDKVLNITLLKFHKKKSFKHFIITHSNKVWVGLTGQRITGQSSPDWLKMMSSCTSQPNSGDLSRF